MDTINEDVIAVQAMIAAAELQPLSSFLGAVVAQEVVKITGRYTPIHQWFHLRCDDVLPPNMTSERYATGASSAVSTPPAETATMRCVTYLDTSFSSASRS